MDIRRTVLWVIFSISLLFLWDNWQRYHGHPSFFAPAPATSPAPGNVPAPVGGVPTASTASVPTAAPGAVAPQTAPAGEVITVTTDVLKVDFDTTGAQMVRAELLAHRDSADKAKNVVLFDRQGKHVYVAQTGLIGAPQGASFPTHATPFKMVSTERSLQGNTLQVRFEAESGGLKLAKTYVFQRGLYEVKVAHEITNTGAVATQPTLYWQLVRDSEPPKEEARFTVTYSGPAVYSEQKKFQKVAFSDIEDGSTDYPTQADNGWVAMIQHYFVSAWIPPQKVSRENYAQRVEGDVYRVGVKQAVGMVQPAETKKVDSTLYVGPQVQDTLENLAPGLELVVDYGIFTVVAKPLFWLLQWLHGLTGNWGWAIVLLTFLVKAAFFPLMTTSYKSMGKMKAVAPRVKRLQEQHKDDRQKMNMAMMELYRKEKINPFGSCLPILVTIPVFISLYWVLLAAVEMRGAPWLGWVQDLSRPDPYYILPVLMAVTMYVQLKLNPTPPDPAQARIMYIMQAVFAVMFLFFPAGLNLYYVVNNILSIAQQWWITKRLENAGVKAS